MAAVVSLTLLLVSRVDLGREGNSVHPDETEKTLQFSGPVNSSAEVVSDDLPYYMDLSGYKTQVTSQSTIRIVPKALLDQLCNAHGTPSFSGMLPIRNLTASFEQKALASRFVKKSSS